MSLKRKASFSAMSFAPSAPAPSEWGMTDSSQHLNSRTRKRFRDGRPSDEVVYGKHRTKAYVSHSRAALLACTRPHCKLGTRANRVQRKPFAGYILPSNSNSNSNKLARRLVQPMRPWIPNQPFLPPRLWILDSKPFYDFSSRDHQRHRLSGHLARRWHLGPMRLLLTEKICSDVKLS
jgi:hypothetical protein